jgi:hypothetical protein
MNSLENNNKEDSHIKERFYHRFALLVVLFFVAVSGFRYLQTKNFQVATGLKSGVTVPIENLADSKILVLVGDTIGQHTNILTSEDGRDWKISKTNAPWSPKSFQSATFHNDSIFMAGGYSGDSEQQNNYFWKSDDGHSWILPSTQIPWESRTGHGFLSFKEKLWVIGGVKFDSDNKIKFFSDVWNSTDGITWEKITDSASWGKRDIRALISFENKMWLFGGSVLKDNNFDNFTTYSDVWVSTDGVAWEKKNVPWGDVGISGAFSIGGSLFVLVGDAFNSDISVYRTDDQETWQQIATDVPFRAYNFSIINTPYFAYIVGGSNDEMPNRKVWKTGDGINWSLMGETPVDIGEGMPTILVPSGF